MFYRASLLFCMLLSVGLMAQNAPTPLVSRPAPTATAPLLSRLRDQLRQHMRDMAESPIQVHSVITYFDSSGKVRKVERKKHIFEVTRVRWRGDESSFRASMRKLDRSTSAEQQFADFGAFFTPSILSLSTPEDTYVVTLQDNDAAGQVILNFRSSKKDCVTFVPSKDGWDLETWCGEGRITFSRDSLMPLTADFQSWGLPSTSGKSVLRSYRVTEEFRTVTLPNEKRTFILPKKVVAIVEHEKGRTVVESEYDPPKPGRQ